MERWEQKALTAESTIGFMLNTVVKNKKLLLSIVSIALFTSMSSMHCSSKSKLADFKWILGTWKMFSGETYFVEKWSRLNDSVFVSNGYKYSAQDTATKTLLESVQLIVKNGEIFYVPVVGGENNGQPVYFKFTGKDKEKDEYTFENKEHHFPQRIIYKPVSKNQLYARVEGTLNDRFTAFEFEYVSSNE